MTDTSTLRIDTRRDDADQTTTFCLIGDIDVTSSAVFAPLHAAPPTGVPVVLDFAQVGRVNSMGLAQLMRLLEAWQGQGVSMQAREMNRTVSMLFKMTGLNRYFGEAPGAGVAGAASAASLAGGAAVGGAPAGRAASGAIRPVARSAPPQLRRVVRSPAAAPAPAADGSAEAVPTPVAEAFGSVEPQVQAPPSAAASSGKLSFAVSLQNNQQLTGWYYLNTLLQRALEQPIALDIQQFDGAAEQAARALPAIAFARPFDACALMAAHGYRPIARPQDDTDEVCIVVRSDDARQNLTEFGRARVVTASQRNFVYLLGRFVCDEYGLESEALTYTFTHTEITALKALMNGQADLLFMLQRNYRQLSAVARADTRVLNDSDSGLAYHMLLVHPDHQVLAGQLSQTLFTLNASDKGRQALQDLGMSAWVAPDDDEIRMLQMLYQRYVPA